MVEKSVIWHFVDGKQATNGFSWLKLQFWEFYQTVNLDVSTEIKCRITFSRSFIRFELFFNTAGEKKTAVLTRNPKEKWYCHFYRSNSSKSEYVRCTSMETARLDYVFLPVNAVECIHNFLTNRNNWIIIRN